MINLKKVKKCQSTDLLILKHLHAIYVEALGR